ncbi:FKBP-type peptidyl-prolyl cis-trans isomerase [Alcanivorax sp. JB21]|uniref:FKBP-type peptidyl-prolyl cis-trans isomerase n=1 Tax=Alcanivorax limicola TaxID=2874102 RepID=UPI001CBD6A88|nr:FKBP-type peptidyl-prolyl cis-trans isomerase [Alcanivorax limicola]MBZ2190335.1 FKBP-type peptidyl-prolyl cis-trans isomerase [Alcanivorax limicola]
MRKLGLVVAIAALAACGQQDNGDVALEDGAKKASYAIGYRTGEQMYGNTDDLDIDAFLSGLRAGALGETDDLPMAAEEMDEAIVAYQQQKMAEREQQMSAAAGDNSAAGEAFREENAARDGVTTLESGLQYEVLESGEGGEKPTLSNEVVAHYHGTLVDGTVFDSSVERDQPATFPLGQVIQGWQEALQMMSVGDKWRIVLPPELAYGNQGAGEKIGPQSTLVFEVELLEVKPGR